MDYLEQARKLSRALAALGTGRLIALGISGLLIFAGTGAAGYLLSRPQFELLYAGLDRQDVTRIGAALRDANIAFDVSSDSASVLVSPGEASKARMLLAEQGLPHSSNVGYELFDKLGSLGLTSFMQEVTRVRALEGELARTIQTMRGVRAARVHLVLPDEGSFRRAKQAPSASVVIRAESNADSAMAQSIRHLVSAAVAGMTVDMVTVLTTDGATLASGADSESAAPGKMFGLEKVMADSLQERIDRTLSPWLGAKNIQVSVVARLNTDKKQTNETTFNPDSRVERSVRVTKETSVTQNSTSQAATSAEKNIPSDKPKGADGKQSNEDNQKREELTNYEVSSKSTSTTSGGYSIEKIGIAILVNKAGLVKGDAAGAADELDKKLAEISDLVSSAAGLKKDRGDTIKVTAVDFTDVGREMEPVAGPGYIEILLRQTGSLISGLSALAIVALVLLVGVKPLAKLAFAESKQTTEAFPTSDGQPLALTEFPSAAIADFPNDFTTPPPLVEDFSDNPRKISQRKLEQIVEMDESETAAVLKSWIKTGEAA